MDELDRSISRNILMDDSYHEDQEGFGYEWLRSHETLVMKAWSHEGDESFENKGNLANQGN